MSADETAIIRAAPADAAALTRIAVAAKRYWNYPESWIAQWLPLLTITPGYIQAHEVYALRHAGQWVGFYALTGAGRLLNLDHLWVAPAWIGQGLGRALLNHALARAAERGAAELEIEADPNAQGFYEHLGACQVGEKLTQIEGQPRRLPVLRLKVQPEDQ